MHRAPVGAEVRGKVAKGILKRLPEPRPRWETTWLNLRSLWFFPRWMERRQERRAQEGRIERRRFRRTVRREYNRQPKEGA